MFAFAGTHSLAVPFTAPSPFVELHIGVILCPNNNAIPLVGKTIHAEVRYEASSGSTRFDGYLSLYNGSTLIAGWADFSADSGAGWIFVEGPISTGLLGSSADAFTEIQVTGFVQAPATGVLYIDNVTID
jgi:hypothetical protein